MLSSDRGPAQPAPAVRRRYYSAGFVIGVLTVALIMLASMLGGLSSQSPDFPARTPLIAMFAGLRLALGDRVFNQVLVGQGGWLEYINPVNPGGFQNGPSLPAGDIENIQKNLERLSAEMRRRGITLIVVIAPDKASIYPDKLPAEIKPIQVQSDLDRLVIHLQQHGPPVLIDLRPTLRAGRQQHETYYQTDTHWNAYGAVAAYEIIMRAVSVSYPRLAPRSIEEFRIEPSTPTVRDLPRLMGAANIWEPGHTLTIPNSVSGWVYINDDDIPMRVSTMPQADSPRLLMYVDSFGELLIPFIAPHFSQATFIENLSDHTDLLSLREVDATQPNVVIVEFVERYLPNFNKWLENYVTGS